MGGPYATRYLVLTPDAEYSATRVSLAALTEFGHSDSAIPPGQKCFLLMMFVTVYSDITFYEAIHGHMPLQFGGLYSVN
jgi:hypothetical protein